MAGNPAAIESAARTKRVGLMLWLNPGKLIQLRNKTFLHTLLQWFPASSALSGLVFCSPPRLRRSLRQAAPRRQGVRISL
jgi:hypothetical protein